MPTDDASMEETPNIKVTPLSFPTLKEVKVKCTSCGFLLHRNVPIKAKKGKVECGICGAKMKWEDLSAGR